MVRIAALVLAGALTPLAAAPVWPAPAKPLALARQAGLKPETHEFLAFHVHAHLDVFVDGKKVVVPAGIGIDIHAPAVRRFELPDGSFAYGGINPPCAKPCISPLHTHEHDGILHTEAKKNEFNRLGQFFKEWKVKLGPSCVATYCKPRKKIAVYVDGKRATGDPRAIELKDRREIAVIVGKPPRDIPSKFPG